ncbi:olfactory receptor 6M1-like [Leptodactylus fuscus]
MVLNISQITEFTLLGFPLPTNIKVIVFTLVLMSYFITLAANFLIITVVRKNSCLYTPMYLFLSNFSLMDIGCTTVIVPKMLADLLSVQTNISFYECIIQFYFILLSGCMANILLAMMGYDRYLAICHPLRYTSIMTHNLCYTMTLTSWITSSLMPLLPTIFVSKLYFCRKKVIDHFFCDFGSLIKLSCSDSTLAMKCFFGQAWIIILTCFSATMISYLFIISTILKIQTNNGREKAFSTCVSHLSVVGIFYGSLIFMYVRPSANTSSYDKIVSVFYSVVTPLLNPIIYSLRNKNIKTALKILFLKERPL